MSRISKAERALRDEYDAATEALRIAMAAARESAARVAIIREVAKTADISLGDFDEAEAADLNGSSRAHPPADRASGDAS